ncbi:transcriptional antiterminator, BglG family protein [Clostridium sartagoforme AAU1]|uniref:Transcriptional antiterminator, BglG family protein n=1 Tax=Clostridium sartagoforme AAU1 TaxID=1202534 RepID=R9CDT6_9CLOT|nr:PTS sugar transporter subunit IIA [Clostridium sartagoforme]EOR27529.1 transcriptional antiterminator, BglG family protein [Clostridium sartagoforme AAU1]
MNKRQMDIIGRVIEDPQFYKVSKLAKIMNKSDRTIYNDLVSINDYFSKYDFDFIQFNENGDIELNDNKKLNDLLNNKIKFDDYELNTEERRSLITCLLFFFNNYITIQNISDLIYCSRSTLLKDFKIIKDELKEDNIEIISHPNKGYKVKADEKDIREKFVEICEKHIFVIKIFFRDKIQESSLLDIQMDLKETHNIVLKEMIKNKFSLTDHSLRFLEFYLFFSLNRIQIGMRLKNYNKNNENFYSYIKTIFLNMLNQFSFEELESEINYLSEMIGNLHFSKKVNKDNSLVTIQLLVKIFIEEMSSTLGIDLSLDKDLFINLSNHMFDILNKKYPGNYEVSEILYYMEKNRNIIQAIEENTYVFENYISRKLTETEVGYLGLHISASLEKSKIINRNLRVLIICNSGVGTVQLLKARLARYYSFTVVDALSVFQLTNYDMENIDFIISTVYLGDMVKLPYVCVSVNLTDQDLTRINSAVSLISDQTSIIEESETEKKDILIRKIEPLVEEHDGLLSLLEATINNYFNDKKEKSSSKLSSFLNEEFIEVDVEAEDWEDAIRKSVKPFHNKNMVKDKFEKEIIDSIRAYGPYIIISDGVAFPHAGFDQGAIKTGFSFMKLKEPVSFSQDGYKDVDLIFALSASDNKMHLDALFSLIELINNEDFKEDLRKLKNKSEVIDCIRKYEGVY